MKVDIKANGGRLRSIKIILTLQEAVLLKRAAWDGPEPTATEHKQLDRLVNAIEKAQETARQRGIK